MGAAQVLRIGKHTIEFVPPDLFRLAVIGDVSLADGLEIIAYVERHGALLRYVLILCDVSKASDVPASVRKYWADRATRLRISGSAMFGASLQTRVFVRMFEGITRLFATPDKPILHEFVKTEKEALAWLEERRRTLPRS